MSKLWICLLFLAASAAAQKDDSYESIWYDYGEENIDKIQEDYQIEDNRSNVQGEADSIAQDDVDKYQEYFDESAQVDSVENVSDEEPEQKNENSKEKVGDKIEVVADMNSKENEFENDYQINESDEHWGADEIPKDEMGDNNDLDLEVPDDIVKEIKEILQSVDDDAKDEYNVDQIENANPVPDEIVKETKEILQDVDEDDKDDYQNHVPNEIVKETKEILQSIDKDAKDDSMGDTIGNENQVPDEIVKETKEILQSIDEDTKDDSIGNENPVPDEIVKETKQILEESDNDFKDHEQNSDHKEEPIDQMKEDLVPDLESQLAIKNYVEPEKNADDGFDLVDYESEEVDSSKEKQEDNIDEKNVEDGSLDNDQDENDENASNDEENDKEFSNDDDSIDKVAEAVIEEAASEESEEYEDVAQVEPKKTTVAKASSEPEPITEKATESSTSTMTVSELELKDAKRIMNVWDLNPQQYDQVMETFKLAHADELDIKKDDELNRNVAPVHISLSVDEPTVVTSPNYPSPYPTNNVVDWIFVGDGMGIELNITDFFVNGVMGAYLLVIPGGIDATSTDGLVFSYRLDAPRRYRFFDVDRMFVRFNAGAGMPFTRGFSFSTKMILPRIELGEDVPLPEPEALIPEPSETITLYLAGLTAAELRSKQEELRHILADMATTYINTNRIDPGINTTLETTQIMRTTVCNVEWPEYELCTQVTFGIPLVYEEQEEDKPYRLSKKDLQAMWEMYSNDDPFASRLMRMGVSEYQVPDDDMLLTAWAVIAAAVVFAMAMLAVALWRFSCYENYTRMPQFSYADSVCSDKKGLDLYPTPHQTLPPLYGDSEYKWDDLKFDDTARVDMGGFNNKSYSRDMYDIDSDEDIITSRDRKTIIVSKDKYQV